jgi:hypothetical protein
LGRKTTGYFLGVTYGLIG